jgi:glycosyltransferase involved in cell wall biosynthesis
LPAVSETFIHGHIERLPAKVTLVHSWPPSVGNNPVLSWPTRIGYKVLRRLSRDGAPNETTAAYIAAFRRARAVAVLAEYGTTGVETMDACRELDIPLIVHFHGYDASVRAVLDEHSETYPLMFHQAAAIIAVSRAMERKLISIGAPPERLNYNPYGINCDNFKGADPSSAPPVFLAVGRFVDKKAPQLTLKAFARMHRSAPEARLRMIGDGPLLDECRELAVELNVQDVVTFLGAQSPAAVQAEMRSARCFVQHSMEAPNGDCEGTPVGILEAGASGLPIVSTRHAGIPDVIVENETGFLVDEGDVDGMAAYMLRLAQEPQLAGDLGRAATQRIENHFSQARSDLRLWKIIESCIVPVPGPAGASPVLA